MLATHLVQGALAQCEHLLSQARSGEERTEAQGSPWSVSGTGPQGHGMRHLREQGAVKWAINRVLFLAGLSNVINASTAS